MDPDKGAGPDDSPPAILKYCAPIPAPPLKIYFAKLLLKGTLPLGLKRGFVVPIFTSGRRNNMRNYLPIAA